MDSRDGKKKKESIDDILSDLNGLLNKMPSILDGIRMPEPQQEEPRPAPAPQRPAASEPPADAGEKTMILEAFSGLSEGAPAPEPAPASEPQAAEPAPAASEPPADSGEKTMILESFSGLPEGAPSPQPAPEAEPQPAAEEKLVPQSLGDFMFGEGAQSAPPEQPAVPEPQLPAAEEPALPADAPAPAPQAVEPEPQEEAIPFPAAAEEPRRPGPEAVFQGMPAEPVSLPTLGLPDSQADSTRDFGIPDIDALLQLSEGAAPRTAPEAAPAAEAQPPAPAPGPAAEASLEPAAAPGEPLPDETELAEFEKQLAAAAPQQGENVENNRPGEEKPEIQPQAEPQPEAQPAAAALPDAFVIEPEAPRETGLEAFTIEPEAQEAAAAPAAEPAPAADAGETLRLEPAAQPGDAPEQPAPGPGLAAGIESGAGISLGEPAPAQEPQFGQGGQEISLGEPAVQAGEAPQPLPDLAGETLQVQPQAEPVLEIAAAPEAQPEPAPAVEEPQLTVGTPGDSTQQFQAAAAQGIELEPASAVVSSGQPPAAQGLTGEETLVVAPPAASSGDEEKTVIFEAGAMPGTTTRSQAGDLAGLAGRPAPEGIPEERVRGVVFVYSAEDKALCATVLAELDAICLKSQTKPMYVKRAAVKELEPDVNSNVLLQTVHDTGAIGMICVGGVPQEKIYELENVFAGANSFFRHYDSSTFSHSSALDLVADLILR